MKEFDPRELKKKYLKQCDIVATQMILQIILIGVYTLILSDKYHDIFIMFIGSFFVYLNIGIGLMITHYFQFKASNLFWECLQADYKDHLKKIEEVNKRR